MSFIMYIDSIYANIQIEHRMFLEPTPNKKITGQFCDLRYNFTIQYESQLIENRQPSGSNQYRLSIESDDSYATDVTTPTLPT